VLTQVVSLHGGVPPFGVSVPIAGATFWLFT